MFKLNCFGPEMLKEKVSPSVFGFFWAKQAKNQMAGFHPTRAFPTFAPAIPRPRSTTDSIGVSEALDSGSIPDAATLIEKASQLDVERHFCFG